MAIIFRDCIFDMGVGTPYPYNVLCARSFARSAFVFSREVASSQGGREGEVAGLAGDRGPPAVAPPRR